MSRIPSALILMITAFLCLYLAGCDVTADRELRRAEKAINEAQEYNAEEHATDDFLAAEQLLIEADELANDNRIQEARQAAIKAKLKAEDALKKAQERQRILDAEMDEIGR